MEVNWIVIGWIIDMILNGIVWVIIAAFGLVLIDVTDTVSYTHLTLPTILLV